MDQRMHRVEGTLQENVEAFSERWGPIKWRKAMASLAPLTPEPTLAKTFWALANVEDESMYMRAKIHWARADRLSSIKDFNTMWLAEEAEHGRALAAMASAFGGRLRRIRHGTFFRDRRAIAGAMAVRLGSVYEAGMLGGYLTLGALQEHTALTMYNAIAKLDLPVEMTGILKEISRQEGRHMRFYKNGALAVFEQYPSARPFVRAVIRRTWRPVGIDLLGFERWREVVAPIVARPGVLARFIQLDDVAGGILDSHVGVMASFLERRGIASIAADDVTVKPGDHVDLAFRTEETSQRA